MTPDDVAKARATIAALRQPRPTLGCKYCEREDCDTDCCFADRHNGTSRSTAAELQAEILAAPLAGWSAALDEVERLRAGNVTLLEQANAASSVVAADWQEIKRLRRIEVAARAFRAEIDVIGELVPA